VTRWTLSALVVALTATLLAPRVSGDAAPVWRIYPLGDSITYGSSTPRDTPGGYRGPLDQLLLRGEVAHRFIGVQSGNATPVLAAEGQDHHDGHPGYRIDQVTADLAGSPHNRGDAGGHWLTGLGSRPALTPDIVLIHLGTNDIIEDYDPVATGRPRPHATRNPKQFAADMAARLQLLVDTIHRLRPRARIAVATIAPLGWPQFAPVVAEYAAAVTRLVDRERARHHAVVLADVRAAFASTAATSSSYAPVLLSPDKIHPSAAGYALMATVFERAVDELIAWS
jgi:lysophospholipase L1-like esterase